LLHQFLRRFIHCQAETNLFGVPSRNITPTQDWFRSDSSVLLKKVEPTLA
jgi:hypothetical protein